MSDPGGVRISEIPGPSSKSLVSYVLVFLPVLISMFPACATALPYVPVLFMASSLVFQLLLLILLYLPFAFYVVRRKAFLLRFKPGFRNTVCLFPVVAFAVWCVAATAFVHLMPARVDMSDEDPIEKRLAECGPVSDRFADLFDIPRNTIVMDPRPPGSFNSYHLEESCNLSIWEIATVEGVVEHLASQTDRVMFVSDVFPFASNAPQAIDLYRRALGLPGTSVSRGRENVEDGFEFGGIWWSDLGLSLKNIYKNDLVEMGVGFRAESGIHDSVVDQSGEPVKIRVGSLDFMGMTGVIDDIPDSLSGLTPPMIGQALKNDYTVFFLGTFDSDWVSSNDILVMPAWDTDPGSLAFRNGGKKGPVLLICDESVSCNIASGIARRLELAGFLPFGLVTLPGALAETLHRPGWTASLGMSRVFVAVLLLVTIFLCPAFFYFLDGVVRRRGLQKRRFPDSVFRLSPIVGLLTVLVLAGVLTNIVTSDIDSPAWFVHRIFRSGGPLGVRMAGPVLLTLATLSLIPVFVLRLKTGFAQTFVGVLLVLGALSFQNCRPGNFHALSYIQVVTLQAGCVAILAWPMLLQWLERRFHTLSETGFTVLSLAAAGARPECGQKVKRLSDAFMCGLDVPDSLVLFGKAGDFVDRSKTGELEQVLKKNVRFGRGPFVVRSSAPDEDRCDRPTPGKYHSETGVASRDLAAATECVVADYLLKGVSENSVVAVLIQVQVIGSLAGVALQEPAALGGGILVEADVGTNFGITSGAPGASVRRDRIGRISHRWLGREFGRRELPEGLFRTVMSIVRTCSGTCCEIEWSMAQGHLYLLQARGSPYCGKGNEATVPGTPADALAILAADRARVAGRRAGKIALDRNDLDDFLHNHSRAGLDLINDIYRVPARGSVSGVLRLLVPMSPVPQIISVAGAFYRNIHPTGSVRNLIHAPAHLAVRSWYRALPGCLKNMLRREYARLLRDLHPGGDALNADGFGGGVRECADRVLRVRERLLAGPGTLSVVVNNLLFVDSGRICAGKKVVAETDPYLMASAGIDWSRPEQKEYLDQMFPHRTMPDLSIEIARPGEPDLWADFPGDVVDKLPPAPDTSVGTRDFLALMRGACRQVLAVHCTILRKHYLDLQRHLPGQDVFDLSVDDLKIIAAKGELGHQSRALFVSGDCPDHVPARLSVVDLERWAATGTPDNPVSGGMRGFWIDRPRDVIGRIVALIDSGAAGGTHLPEPSTEDDVPVVLLRRCDVRTVLSVPAGYMLISESGTALSHAALVTIQRGQPAVFGAAGSFNALSEGARVRIDRHGRIEMISML